MQSVGDSNRNFMLLLVCAVESCRLISSVIETPLAIYEHEMETLNLNISLSGKTQRKRNRSVKDFTSNVSGDIP